MTFRSEKLQRFFMDSHERLQLASQSQIITLFSYAAYDMGNGCVQKTGSRDGVVPEAFAKLVDRSIQTTLGFGALWPENFGLKAIRIAEIAEANSDLPDRFFFPDFLKELACTFEDVHRLIDA
jgi:hypothetical protein